MRLLLIVVFACAAIITMFVVRREPVKLGSRVAQRSTVPVPVWPVFDARCNGNEVCLLERYRAAHVRLIGMEVGGLEVLLGEALAGAAGMHAAITPPDGRPSVEACNKLSREPVTVASETLRRPQRDCFFECLRGSQDALECARAHGCARLPVLDGGWDLVQIVPRLGCLASLAATTSARCMKLEESTDQPGTTTSCEPRRMCKQGASEVPDQMRPFVIAGATDCATRPATWWCQERRLTFPRAACQYGS